MKLKEFISKNNLSIKHKINKDITSFFIFYKKKNYNIVSSFFQCNIDKTISFLLEQELENLFMARITHFKWENNLPLEYEIIDDKPKYIIK